MFWEEWTGKGINLFEDWGTTENPKAFAELLSKQNLLNLDFYKN